MFPTCLPTAHPRTRVLTDRDKESRIIPALTSDLSPFQPSPGSCCAGELSAPPDSDQLCFELNIYFQPCPRGVLLDSISSTFKSSEPFRLAFPTFVGFGKGGGRELCLPRPSKGRSPSLLPGIGHCCLEAATQMKIIKSRMWGGISEPSRPFYPFPQGSFTPFPRSTGI